jgi:hypothetical protein
LLAHVIHPDKKSDEADYDEQLIEPWTHPVHDLKDELKKACDEMPERVHGLLFLRWHKNRNSIER